MNDARRSKIVLHVLWLSVSSVWCSGAAPLHAGERLWDLSPYTIQLTIGLDLPGLLERQVAEHLPGYLEQRVANSIGPIWRMRIAVAAGSARHQLLRGLAGLSQDAAPADFDDVDKLIFLTIRQEAGGYELQAREYDRYVERWSPVLRTRSRQLAGLPETVFEFVQRVFAPLAQLQVDAEDDQLVRLSMRGSGLDRPGEAPGWVASGDVFLPVLRRTTRDGALVKDGVQPVPWTVVVAEGEEDGVVLARIQSGARRPLSARRRGRIEQVAIALRGTPAPMTIQLVSRSDPAKRLVGYDAYAQDPADKSLVPLGSTNWDGELLIQPARSPVRLLVLKNGDQLLARLPVVPGPQTRMEIPLPDDDPRLQAEATMLALREELIDLVARRQILMARIDREIERNNRTQAANLLNGLEELPGRPQFNRRVTQEEQLHHSSDPQIQQRIDRLFADARLLLGHFLDNRDVDQLRDRLSAIP